MNVKLNLKSRLSLDLKLELEHQHELEHELELELVLEHEHEREHELIKACNQVELDSKLVNTTSKSNLNFIVSLDSKMNMSLNF